MGSYLLTAGCRFESGQGTHGGSVQLSALEGV
jgi:hypothetical protein